MHRASRQILLRLPHLARALAAAPPRSVAWSELSTQHRQAWEVLGWTESAWSGASPAPVTSYSSWDELSPAQQAAAQHGLGIPAGEWEQQSEAGALTVESDSAPPPTDKPAVQSSLPALGSAAWRLAKAVAPSLGAGLKKARVGGRAGVGLTLAGYALEALPGLADSMSDAVVVEGIETSVYLDDSGSMSSSRLQQGQAALEKMAPLLGGPTRVIKFGMGKSVLAPREEGFSTSLVSMCWDGSSGGTYMWHMIQEDVLERYRPGGGKLRLVVVTDGHDTMSPGEYSGLGGMHPMMRTLTAAGYEIEWHIVVIGDVESSQQYEALTKATGGSYLAIEDGLWFDEGAPKARAFLDALADSGCAESGDEARRQRQRRYELDVSQGRAERFDWYKALPPPDRGGKDSS